MHKSWVEMNRVLLRLSLTHSRLDRSSWPGRKQEGLLLRSLLSFSPFWLGQNRFCE